MTKIKKYVKDNKQQNVALKIISVIAVVLIAVTSISGCIGQESRTIEVSGANALQPMMEIWAEEYEKIHPDIKVNVNGGGAGLGMTQALAGSVDIGMVSRDIRDSEISQGAFWVSVAKDTVVATMNANNPVKDILYSKGVNRSQLEDIFTQTYAERTIKTWGQLVGNESASNQRIWVYTRQDSCGAAEMWAKFLGSVYVQGNLTNAADDASSIEDGTLRVAISGNTYAIGYNNLNTCYNLVTKRPYDGILPVPIDLNENGILDENESFYNTSTELVDAISNDTYPSPPTRNLHLVTKDSFSGIVKEFVEWILTDGQQYVSSSGYVELSDVALAQQLEHLQTG
jgi:phosphate transport system substrate-binding protein